MNLSSFEKATSNSIKSAILGYLHDDIGNCAYLYLDIQAYGLESSVIDIWLQRDIDGHVAAIAMRYSDSLQLYATTGFESEVNYEDLHAIIAETDAKRISGTQTIIERLAPLCGERFEKSFGFVLELTKYRHMKRDDVVVEKARREDIPEIVSMIVADNEVGKGYEREIMIAQFEQRFDDKAGLSFVVRKDDVIVAHLGITAMSDDFAIAGKTVVHPEHREFPYGAFLDSCLINTILPSLGKRGFAYMLDERRVNYFTRMGNNVVGKYGKLLIP